MALPSRFLRPFLSATIGVLAVLAADVSPLQAQTRCVDSADEDGGDGSVDDGTCAETCDGSDDCGIRDALDSVSAGSADTIIFKPGLTGPILVTGSSLTICRSGGPTDIHIVGPGADQLTIEGDGSSRVFSIPDCMPGFDITDVTISGLTISGGKGGIFLSEADSLVLEDSVVTGNDAGTDDGGGIEAHGPLTVDNSTIDDNRADIGGGIFFSATGIETFLVRNSTISNNRSSFDGGGLASYSGGNQSLLNTTISGNQALAGGEIGGGIVIQAGATMSLANVTITDNTATSGGGIANSGGTLLIKNTVIADNAAGGDCSGGGSNTSLGYNIDSDGSCNLGAGTDQPSVDPKLGPLAANGGPTLTHALLEDSPALDKGDNVDCPTDDQRGVSRPLEGDGAAPVDCDIGAFEAGCSDGIVQAFLDEECDDGDTTDGDGCDSNCLNEAAPACGDGILQAGEECDDGDTTSGDGCSSECLDEDDGGDGDGDGGGCSLIREQ